MTRLFNSVYSIVLFAFAGVWGAFVCKAFAHNFLLAGVLGLSITALFVFAGFVARSLARRASGGGGV